MKQKRNKQQLIWWPVEFKVFDACSGSNLKSKYTRRQKGTVQLKYASYWARSLMTSSRSSGVKKAKVWEVWLSVSFWVILENHQMTEDREAVSCPPWCRGTSGMEGKASPSYRNNGHISRTINYAALPGSWESWSWTGKHLSRVLQRLFTNFKRITLLGLPWTL